MQNILNYVNGISNIQSSITDFKYTFTGMEKLKYTIIKTRKQYDEYCKILEDALDNNFPGKEIEEEIELMTFLIEKWDAEHTTFSDVDPVSLLKYLMTEHKLKPKDLVYILGVSKSLVSEILNYKKGLSKDIIRKLSGHFKLTQDAFNKPYKLITPLNLHLRNASVMNTTKQIKAA
jgi:HTH-type transcriptional regulator/antitoxin HigA